MMAEENIKWGDSGQGLGRGEKNETAFFGCLIF